MGIKIRVTRPKVKVTRTAKCLICGRQVRVNAPHKCPKRKAR